MCGVGHEMVDAARPQLAETANSKRTGTDGKQYPARKELTETETTKKEGAKPERKPETKREIGPPFFRTYRQSKHPAPDTRALF